MNKGRIIQVKDKQDQEEWAVIYYDKDDKETPRVKFELKPKEGEPLNSGNFDDFIYELDLYNYLYAGAEEFLIEKYRKCRITITKIEIVSTISIYDKNEKEYKLKNVVYTGTHNKRRWEADVLRLEEI